MGEVYERSLKIEAELRLVDEISAELSRVKSDIQKMTADREEFTSKLREINQELVLARSELKQLPNIQEEIQALRQQVIRGRAAIEYEKKMQANNLEKTQIMEKTMIYMAREIEKLHAELADAEKRAMAAAAVPIPSPGYPSVHANTEAVYGNFYSDHYPVQQVCAKHVLFVNFKENMIRVHNLHVFPFDRTRLSVHVYLISVYFGDEALSQLVCIIAF